MLSYIKKQYIYIYYIYTYTVLQYITHSILNAFLTNKKNAKRVVFSEPFLWY